MNLKAIAACALDEFDAARENAGMERHDNGDGTVDLTFSFSLDPNVVAEKAKAMGKGVKREDLSDDLGDAAPDDEAEIYADDVEDDSSENEGEDGSGVDEDEDIYNGVNTEDSATCDTVFMDALDSINGEAMDARTRSRHAQTPLANCRAKDPRFCPYHGDKAWTEHINQELANAGISGAAVSVSEDNGVYSVKVSGVNGSNANAVSAILGGILQTKGVVNTGSGASSVPGKNEVVTEFGKEWGTMDRVGRLNEWINDFIEDYAGDANRDIDMDDMSALLEAVDDVETFAQSMNAQDPNAVAQFNTMVDDAEEKYHSLVAQQYFDDVADVNDANDVAKDIETEYADADKDFQDSISEVKAAKTAIFGGKGEFPRANAKKGIKSFQDMYPWVKAYNKAASAVGRAGSEYAKASASLASAVQNAPSDVKGLRTALSSMDYLKDNFALRAASYPKAKGAFMRSFYDWADAEAQNPGNQYGITAASVAAAFPNGKPM